MFSSAASDGLPNKSASAMQAPWSPPQSLLEAVSGDDDLIADLIEAFSSDTEARMKELRTALEHADFSRIRVEAHTIKGGARQVGADAVADACQELEAISKLEEPPAAAEQMNKLQDLFERARREMASYSGSWGLSH